MSSATPVGRNYGVGWFLGIAAIAALCWAFRAATVTRPLQVGWTPAVVRWVDEPLRQGQPRKLILDVVNQGRGTARLDELICRKPFVRLVEPSPEKLPLKLPPGARQSVTWEITPDSATWGIQEVEFYLRVSHGAETQAARCVLAFQAAGWVNPEPNHWSFGRLGATSPSPTGTIQLWRLEAEPEAERCTVISSDPAVTVTESPLDLVNSGRHFFRELTVRVDPRRVQARHRSYLEVRAEGRPPVLIPITGWSDVAGPTESR